MKVCVTGASGFIGSAVIDSLLSCGIKVLPLVRNKLALPDNIRPYASEMDLDDLAAFDAQALDGCDCLIHTAAHVHITKHEKKKRLDVYRSINRDATLKLASLAASSGVKRFIFLSSIGVNGSCSTAPFCETDKASPHDDYSLSKYEAEIGLFKLAHATEMDVVIIRAPLVYGNGASGTFKRLFDWLFKGYPIPFKKTFNLRSFIALDNLVSFILLCADNNRSPCAANQIFLVSDCRDISISNFILKVASAHHMKLRLFPLPILLSDFILRLLGRKDISYRLFRDLQVDASKARNLLNWEPVVTMEQQLSKDAHSLKPANKK